MAMATRSRSKRSKRLILDSYIPINSRFLYTNQSSLVFLSFTRIFGSNPVYELNKNFGSKILEKNKDTVNQLIQKKIFQFFAAFWPWRSIGFFSHELVKNAFEASQAYFQHCAKGAVLKIS